MGRGRRRRKGRSGGKPPVSKEEQRRARLKGWLVIALVVLGAAGALALILHDQLEKGDELERTRLIEEEQERRREAERAPAPEPPGER